MGPEVQKVVGRLSGVTAAADELARMPSSDPAFLARVGKAYTMVGAHDRAADFFARAVKAAPMDADLHYSLGAALVFRGDFQGAKTHLTRAVELEPRHFPAWYSLVVLEKQTPTSNHISHLGALFAGPDPIGHRKLHMGHAMAKTFEDLGDYPRAFEWLLKAKADRARKASYSAAGEAALFAAAREAAGAGKGTGFGSEEPVFIVGMPRTGTTLLESILGAHPDVTAAGELGIFPVLVKVMAGGGDGPLLDATYFAAMADADLGRLGRAYVEATRPVSGRTARFIDKTPINILYAGLILRALPNARVICLRREPMDSVISYFRHMFFAWPHVYPSIYDLENAARHYVEFHRLADHWAQTLPADRYLEQGYEALVEDQEGQTRRMLAFLGLPFDERSLKFHEQEQVVSTASAVQVRQPLYASAVGRWRRYGPQLQPAVDILREAAIPVEG